MPNGTDTSLKEMWEGVDKNNQAEVNFAVKSSMIFISERLERLPCEKHHSEISMLKKFMWTLIGMGSVIIFLVSVLPLLKKS